MLYVVRIIFDRDQVTTGPRASFYLILQTGSGSVFKKRVFALPYLEHLLQDVERVTNTVRAGEWTEITTFLFLRTAMKRQSWIFVPSGQ